VKIQVDELTYEYPTDRKPVVVGEKRHTALIRGSAGRKRPKPRKKPGKK